MYPEKRWQDGEDDSVVYQGVSLPVTMHLANPDGQGGHKDVVQEWTAVVVHSSQLDTVHKKTAETKNSKAEKSLVASATKLSKKQFETELQAGEAVEQMLRATAKQRRGFKHSVQVTPMDVALPRTRKGRPKAGELTPSRQVYQVNVQFEPDEQKRDEQEQMAGLFVLVSSRKVEEFSMSWVLDTYREQNQVEDGFRWIKAPAQIAPVLLHTPTRIAALGMLFVIALAVYRVLQHRIRRNLLDQGKTIPGHNRVPTEKPTLAQVMWLFRGVRRVRVQTPQGTMQWFQGYTPLHREVLRLLDLPEDLYENPERLAHIEL